MFIFQVSTPGGAGSSEVASGSTVGLGSTQHHPAHVHHAVLTRHTSVATSMLRQLNQLS